MSSNRVVMYYQTQKQYGNYISPLPLIGYITHLFLAAFHLNMGNMGPDIVHLNDFMPSDPYYAPMWPDMAALQGNGTKIIGMLGGAAPGTYECLVDGLFDTYYPPLRDVIHDYKLDGLDLDVEEYVSPQTITKLILQLKSDFGDDFIITLAPVASALTREGNLSGFDYVDLEHNLGHHIDWYNAQFYSGFGTFFPESEYIDIIEYDQGINPDRVVALVLTNPENGYGYISEDSVVESIGNLMEKYGTNWGGVGGWEYFNSYPDLNQPWKWAQMMKSALVTTKAKLLARDGKESESEGEEEVRVKSRVFRGLNK
ncbi:hypothetical protein V5O48_003427 [Marasmius crinis-equi]|uniref:GH18 domain-containing protein n=1 Tax=Marasmius crinis-equi TaxID=585013 RepID=A0ABR3FSX9_9AGAR